MSLIFLDIDGVLRTPVGDTEWSVEDSLPIPQIVFHRKFSKKAVANLNEIISYTKSKVVITSTWRTKFSIEDLKSIFRRNKVYCDIIDFTYIGLNRGEEIQVWLDYHNYTDSYIVIDDQVNDILKYISKDRVIKCEHNVGLTYEDSSRAIDILFTI